MASNYNVALNTISTWLKNKEKIINAVTKGKPKTGNLKGGSYDKLDQAVYKNFLNVRSQNIPVSGPMLKEKAMSYARQLQIADFKESDGWLDRLKTRRGITFKTIAGEASSCTPEMTASWEQTTLPTILSSYNLADIYNADEFGPFYQALPEKSLHFKSEKCVRGGKYNRIRLTGMAAANVLGEKLPMFVIGSATSKTLPMDHGIIRALKAHYRSKAAQMYITAIEKNRPIPNISIPVDMDMLVAAWDKVTQGAINNCFRAAGMSHQSQESALSDDEDPFMTLAEEINNLRERAPEVAPENVTAGTVVECDDGEATFEADPLTDEDILAEFNHSADSNEEEEEEMDEDEIVIIDEPPKPPTQCELRHAIGVLNTFSFFADDAHLDNLRKSTRNISQIIDQSFSVAKRQHVITNYFS
ncbi:Tigger transposable element-derived protein 4 [Stylophora pistillata]|uniref:Tigger transposable element-derived protein 4 n=1 Tax=Stylophora pistillata TaxID=50429 RepID=A0A2B4S093_STYPI|nr:Tigger transposable element-derived protein 4 [Stylophora pistillata]